MVNFSAYLTDNEIELSGQGCKYLYTVLSNLSVRFRTMVRPAALSLEVACDSHWSTALRSRLYSSVHLRNSAIELISGHLG